MNKRILIMTGVGLAVGFAEALVYYNIGQNRHKENFAFGVPRGKELGATLAALAITAILTAGITEGLEKLLDASENRKLAIA